MLIDRTNTLGDFGLQLWGVPASAPWPSEAKSSRLQVSFAAKKFSGTGTLLNWNLATFDADFTFLGYAGRERSIPWRMPTLSTLRPR